MRLSRRKQGAREMKTHPNKISAASVLAVVYSSLLIGCTTSNDEGWTITSPAANTEFEIPAVKNGFVVDVLGTANVANSTNNLVAIDVMKGQYLGSPVQVVTDSQMNWKHDSFMIPRPDGLKPIIEKRTVRIATGTPTPPAQGHTQNIKKYSSVDIKVKTGSITMP
jgi:hypothetical protein